MKNKTMSFKTLGKFLLLILLVGIFAANIMGLTYSTTKQASPDVLVTINNKGELHQEGDLFGNQLWYPGMDKKGIIRIDNQYKEIKASKLKLDVELLRLREDYDHEMVRNSFLQNMRLSISRGKLAILDKEIIKDMPLGELLDVGLHLAEGGENFFLEKNDFIDLKYRLRMDVEAGNELQDLTANIAIGLGLEENIVQDGDDKPIIVGPEDPHDHEELADLPRDLIILGEAHWAHDCIITLLRHGIIRGYPDGTIRPDQPITRAESAALIAKALRLQIPPALSTDYVDPIPEWAKGYISAVSDRGIFVGYPMKTFKAEKNISRQEMVTVLIKGFTKDLCPDIGLDFIDREDIGSWALKYVKAGVGHEILRGYPDGSFRPRREITRAEAFTIICKLLGLHDEHI